MEFYPNLSYIPIIMSIVFNKKKNPCREIIDILIKIIHSLRIMAKSIEVSYERFEAEIKYLKTYSYDDQTYLIYLDQESLFLESDMLIYEFLTSEDLEKCRIFNVFKKVVGPILQNILVYFTSGKTDYETLMTNVLRMGMTSKYFENHFNDDNQMDAMHQNQDFGDFDITLKFKWILFFIEFDQILFKNEDQKRYLFDIIKYLKDIRNNLCHNRKNVTSYHDLLDNMNFFLSEILEIMHTWDVSIDILIEKEKLRFDMNKIMTGVISSKDFRYMCLLKVLDLVVYPALDTAATLICNKKEDEHFKDYFSNHGINERAFKDRFFRNEKIILDGKSKKMKPDITLLVKIIDICKEWHPALKNDHEAREELKSIIKNIRDIRNHIVHNILSMTIEECIIEAKKIVKYLNHLGNFVLNKNLYVNHDIPTIDTNQIDYHIHYIMHLTYPYA